MKLPIPFLKTGEKDSKIYYLALLLATEKVSAVILEESSGKIKIVKRHNQLLHKNIEDLEFGELTEAIDKAISRSEETLPPDVEIRKTVFGVKQDWVEGETKKIKRDYLQKLKKVCDTLDLSPIGFMVISEAISSLMQEEEGAPLSAIFVELGKKVVTINLFRGGKIVQTLTSALEGSYAQTVDHLLKQFTTEVLPARITLYDSEIEEKTAQEFIGHHWSKGLPFLHMPQISVLPDGFDGRAVAFGAASQLGFEVLDNGDAASAIKTYNSGGVVVREEKEHGEEKLTEKKQHEEVVGKHEGVIGREEGSFGFVPDQDIAEKVQKAHVQHAAPHHEVHTGTHHLAHHAEKTEHEQTIASDSLAEPNSEHFNSRRANRRGSFLKGFSFPKMGFSLPSFGSKGIFLPIIFVVIFIGVVIGGVYYFYFNNVSAKFIVTLTPKNEAQSENVTFASGETNDFDNNIVAAKKVNGSLDGNMTIGVTGKKDVGEKAKGKVTIYNNDTGGSVTLSDGASIKSENGLSFTLDKKISVASASGDVFSGTKPGTTDVEVTASEIGTNYNLPSGTKFSVAGNNSLAAKNDDAFSGGTKKTVSVVSKDDLNKLKTDLIKNLSEKASDELAKQAASDVVILPVVLSTDIKSTKYDKNAGDESKTVKLSASVSFVGLSYNKDDLKEFAKSVLEKKYSDDMTIDGDAIEASVKNVQKENDKEISADVAIDASLFPKIETDRLGEELSGKSVKNAEEVLSRLSQVEKTEVVYEPNISILEKIFPSLPKHVTVTISSN